MVNVTQATKNSYLRDSGNKQLTINFPNLNITLTNKDLVNDDFELTERVNADETIQFIGCLASVVKFTTKSLKVDVKGELIYIYITCNNTETIPIFHGFVDEVEQKPHQKDKTITAYDILYSLSEINIAEWYLGLQFPLTIKDIRDSLFTLLGIPQATITLPADDIQIVRQYEPSELKALDVIKSICQINCVFGRIGRDADFHYVLPPNTSTVVQDITYYKSATYQEYFVKPVDKFTIRQSGEDDIVIGNGDNNYIIIDNFFTKGLGSDVLSTLAQTLFNNISAFNYQPFEADVNSLPYIECLDVISLPVKDLDTEIVSQQPYLVLERTIKGIQALRDTFKADGDEFQRVFESDLSIQVEELKRQMEVLRSDMDNLKFAYYLLSNTEGPIEVGDGETENLFDMYFAAKSESVVMFNCEILLDAETTANANTFYDAVATIKYYVDEQEIGYFNPKETWQDGEHILNLYYYIIVQDSGTRRFRATISMTGGSVVIPESNLKASLYGQNLVASNDFNGILEVKDTAEAFTIPNSLTFTNATDSVNAPAELPLMITPTDNPAPFNLGTFTFNSNVTEEVHIERIKPNRITEDETVRVTEDEIIRKVDA